MPSKALHLVLAALFFLLVGPTFASDQELPLPEGTLSQDEVIKLFVDKTVESVTVVQGRVSVSYYSPDGEVRQQRDGQKRNGTWRINKNGRICLAMEGDEESCRIIVREGDKYVKYVVKNDGNHQPVVRYNWFKPGNPLGL